ncbi:MAG TPA: DUF6034 family protein [Clostridia bacterium]|nr:DUF6034 family protein [Clostridia bacterium]
MNFMREDYLDAMDVQLLKDFEGEFPISYAEALESAQNVIRDFKIEDMVLSFGKKACTYYNYGLGSKGWEFVFTRENNGMPSYYVDGATIWNNDSLPILKAPWNKEVLFILVDKDGIFRFNWRGAARQTSVLAANVELLPFDDILERAEQQLMYQHVVLTENGYDEVYLRIYEIRLGSVLVNIPGKIDVGRDIPAWDFLYEIRIVADSTEICDKYVTCFNAIDGSYIEPRLQ